MKVKINSWVAAIIISVLYAGFYFVILNIINPEGNEWTLAGLCIMLGEVAISLSGIYIASRIIRKFFAHLRQGKRYALLIIVSALFYCAVYLLYWAYLIRLLFYGLPTDAVTFAPQVFGSMTGLHLPVAIITIVALYTAEMYHVQHKVYTLEKAVAETKLKSLQKQVDPHFLFNSLNILTALIRTDTDRSILFTQKLSEVYRFYLSTRRDSLISSDEEIAFVRNYFYLIECRFGAAFSLHVTESKDGSPGNRYIVPGTIQLLVENVIKHNTATETEPIRIDICLEDISVTVTNKIHRKDNPGSGYGLSNLAEQYQLIAGRSVAFFEKDGLFVVTIPLFKSVPV